VTAAARQEGRVELVALDDADEASGVNDRLELARVHRLLIERAIRLPGARRRHLSRPGATSVGADVAIGADTTVHAMTTLLGTTRDRRGCELHAGAWLRDSTLGDGVVVEPYSVIDGAASAPAAASARSPACGRHGALRRGARGQLRRGQERDARPRRQGGHLAYLGDATIGAGANVGAGVVTCNYDGVAKHRTEIGARAFVGSDTMLVAPVTVGDDATTGAGSVITQDVPDGALAVERARQRTVDGWAARRRKP
jgi:bifunctional UDP-N-acetylglucosamine pyrophosphorylase / glucosamine-1-phosphate N-acetyltransferase